METLIIWLVVMIPLSAFLTGLGIYAMRRKKPMWFWTGRAVKEEEINDIPAYNKANGIMWIAFSLVSWASTVAGCKSLKVGGLVLLAGCIVAVPILLVAYNKIYKKYKRG